MFGSGDFGDNHPRDFWKFWNFPCFNWAISKFSKKDSQIVLPNIQSLVQIFATIRCIYTIIRPVMVIIINDNDNNDHINHPYYDHHYENILQQHAQNI